MLSAAGQNARSSVAAKGSAGKDRGHYSGTVKRMCFRSFCNGAGLAKKRWTIAIRISTGRARMPAKWGLGHGALFRGRTITGSELLGYYPVRLGAYHFNADSRLRFACIVCDVDGAICSRSVKCWSRPPVVLDTGHMRTTASHRGVTGRTNITASSNKQLIRTSARRIRFWKRQTLFGTEGARRVRCAGGQDRRDAGRAERV
jgi:hypothetical protein